MLYGEIALAPQGPSLFEKLLMCLNQASWLGLGNRSIHIRRSGPEELQGEGSMVGSPRRWDEAIEPVAPNFWGGQISCILMHAADREGLEEGFWKASDRPCWRIN